MLRAGVVLGEEQLLPIGDDGSQSAGQGQGSFQGVRQTGADVRAYHQAVHNHLNGVLFVFFQLYVLAEVIKVPVNPHPHIAGTARAVQLLDVLALAAPHNRRQNLDAGLFRQLHYPVHHLVHRLLGDLSPADGAVGNAYPGVQQAKVVVNFGDGAHSGTRVLGGGLLIDGDGGGEALNIVHIRLFHLSQELAGIGGKAFHIAPLAVGVKGVEGQGGFP